MRTSSGNLAILLCVATTFVTWASSAAAQAAGYAVSITLPEQPPSRIYCSLTKQADQKKVDNDDHAEIQVEFDPATSSRLSRTVTVPAGDWLLACSAEAKPQLVTPPGKEAGSAPVNAAWQFEAKQPKATLALKDAKAEAEVVAKPGDLSLTGGALAARATTITVKATASELPSLKAARRALSTQEGGRIGGRSLDASAPALVQDTLQILAEIAVDRARTRGYALVSQRITELVCEEAKAPQPIPELGIATGQNLLPNTCNAVRNMNLHEIAQAGPTIGLAVEKDLVAFALNATLQQLTRGSLQLKVPPALIQQLMAAPGIDVLLRTGKLPPATVAELTKILLAQVEAWKPANMPTRSAELVSCGLQTALRAGQACYDDAACRPPADMVAAVKAKVDVAAAGSKTGGKTCTEIFKAAQPLELAFATELAQAAFEHLRRLSTVGSLPDLSLELVLTVSHLSTIYAANTPNAEQAAVARHASFVLDSLSLLVQPLLSGRTPTAREVQLVLIRLADHDWVSKPATVLECGLEVAFGAIAACHGSDGGCDARALADFIAHPEEHFALGDCQGLLADLASRGGLQQGWPQISEFVAQGVDIVAPPPGATPRDQARSAVSLVFNLAAALGDPSMTPRTKELLGHMKELSLGIVDEDTRSSLVAGIAIARTALDTPTASDEQRKLLTAIERFTPIITTLTANARSLKEAAANPEQAEALRKARKESIEALIDASTDRNGRGGEWVVSLGAGVGFYTGWKAHHEADESDKKKTMTTLGLPMGLAVQELPGSKKQKAWDTGLQAFVPDHFQATFVDLGQFVAQKQDKVRWNDFLLIGAQVGWIPNLFQSPSDALIFGADIRYIPGGSRKGDLFAGGFVAYYVPFFDLN